MKTFNQILLGIFIIAGINMKLFAQLSPDEQKLLGEWKAEVDDPNAGICTIYVTWYENHTADAAFICKEFDPEYITVRWSYDGKYYYETFNGGGKGKAEIRWINDNEFELKIIENQDTETYKDVVRVFKRVDS